MTGWLDLNNGKVFFSSSLVSALMCVVFIISRSLPFCRWRLGHRQHASTGHKAFQLHLQMEFTTEFFFSIPDNSPTGPYGPCPTKWSGNECPFPRPPVEGQRQSEVICERRAVFIITRGNGDCSSKQDLQQTAGFMSPLFTEWKPDQYCHRITAMAGKNQAII